jgi:hypothetical protein
LLPALALQLRFFAKLVLPLTLLKAWVRSCHDPPQIRDTENSRAASPPRVRLTIRGCQPVTQTARASSAQGPRIIVPSVAGVGRDDNPKDASREDCAYLDSRPDLDPKGRHQGVKGARPFPPQGTAAASRNTGTPHPGRIRACRGVPATTR